MRAVWLREFGGPEVLVAEDAPDPVAGPGQAVVEVAFANITFIETQFRATGFGPFRPDLPMIPGNGVGGLVAAVGEGVDAGLVGARVVTSTGGSGGYAERVAIDAGGLIPVPDEVALDDATALLADGRTALWVLDAAGCRPASACWCWPPPAGWARWPCNSPGRSARWWWAPPAGRARWRSYAASGRRRPSTTPGRCGPMRSNRSTSCSTASAAISPAPRSGRSLRVGACLSFGAASGDRTVISAEDAADRAVTLVAAERLTPERQRVFTARALAEAAAGRLVPVIGQRVPLDRAADAHAAIETRDDVGQDPAGGAVRSSGIVRWLDVISVGR